MSTPAIDVLGFVDTIDILTTTGLAGPGTDAIAATTRNGPHNMAWTPNTVLYNIIFLLHFS